MNKKDESAKLLDKVGRYEFLSEPFHCDFNHRLFIGHLGNHLLNAADFHSNDRGYGMAYLNTVHKTWVLSRLAIEMNELPKAYEKFDVETWVENAMRYFTSRNFAVVGRDGRAYGYGRSIWAMIDTDTRQPVDLLAIRGGLIEQYIDKEKACPIEKPSRVGMSDGAQKAGTVCTHYSDIDVNGHVNRVKYIEHIMDLWDVNWYRRYRVRRLEIAYVAESYGGDRLNFYTEPAGENVYCIRVTKLCNDGADELEVCRGRIIFEENRY